MLFIIDFSTVDDFYYELLCLFVCILGDLNGMISRF